MIDPPVPQGRFENLTQRHDFLVHGIARGRLATLLDCFLMAMNPVLLDLSGCDLGKTHVAEERHQMKPQPCAVAFHVLGVALPLGDDLVFAVELRSDFATRACGQPS